MKKTYRDKSCIWHWEKHYFPLALWPPMTFDLCRGQGSYHFLKKIYWDKKVLELHETCRSVIKFFRPYVKKFSCAPFGLVQPLSPYQFQFQCRNLNFLVMLWLWFWFLAIAFFPPALPQQQLQRWRGSCWSLLCLAPIQGHRSGGGSRRGKLSQSTSQESAWNMELGIPNPHGSFLPKFKLTWDSSQASAKLCDSAQMPRQISNLSAYRKSLHERKFNLII
jgi:hypothetical protein